MKQVHLRRHGEKDPTGVLTQKGEVLARELGKNLPHFVKIVSSPSSRTRRTAELMTGQEPEVDERAGFYMAPQEKSDAINQLAAEQGLTFLEAVQRYQDPEVLEGVDKKPTN